MISKELKEYEKLLRTIGDLHYAGGFLKAITNAKAEHVFGLRCVRRMLTWVDANHRPVKAGAVPSAL